MPRRDHRMKGNSDQSANKALKVRISKGFIDASYGDGFLVEVWDFRTQRLVYGERFKDLEKARRRQREIQNDLENMTMDRFQQVYASRITR